MIWQCPALSEERHVHGIDMTLTAQQIEQLPQPLRIGLPPAHIANISDLPWCRHTTQDNQACVHTNPVHRYFCNKVEDKWTFLEYLLQLVRSEAPHNALRAVDVADSARQIDCGELKADIQQVITTQVFRPGSHSCQKRATPGASPARS